MKAGILAVQGNTNSDNDVLIPFVTPTAVVSNQPVFSADTLSLKRFSTSQGVQRWEIETRLFPSNNSPDFLVHSVVNASNNLIFLRVPQVYNKNIYAETTTYDDAIPLTTSGSTSYNININANLNGRIGKGEFINIGTRRKVHLVTGTTNAGLTLNIYPKAAVLTAGQAVYFGRRCTMIARYDDSTILGITYVDGILSDPGSVKFIEALE